MRTIWKQVLPQLGNFELKLPAGAEIVALREQHDEPTIWFVCDSEAKPVLRRFVIVGTGHQAPNIGKHVGTFFVDGGMFVFHVFEIETNWS